MVLVAFERLLATVRAREYEKENIVPVIVVIIILLVCSLPFSIIFPIFSGYFPS